MGLVLTLDRLFVRSRMEEIQRRRTDLDDRGFGSWESEFCKGYDPVQVSRALAEHGMLKCAKDRYTYAEPFEGERNKRFHVIRAKILVSDYDRTPEDTPDDDDGVGERRF